MTYKNFSQIKIDDARINEVCDAYFKWKDLNTYIKSTSSRGINIPDAISEPMACYCFDLMWNRGPAVGDATDSDGKRVECKATSNFDGDLSSFGPNTVFDRLIYLRYNLSENKVYMYDLGVDSTQLGSYPANKTQTIQDQKDEGRRPHVSLQKLFVESNNLQPTVIFDIRRCKIN